MSGLGFAALILLGAGAVYSACRPWEIRFTKRTNNDHEGQTKP